MDFSLSGDQKALRETARRFAQQELITEAERVEREDEPPSPEIMRRFAEMGFLGINLPEEYGGHGLGHLEAALVLEEVAKVSPAVAFPIFDACFGPVLAIAHFAPVSLRHRVIPKVVSGEWICDRHVRTQRRVRLDRSINKGQARKRAVGSQWIEALVLRRRTRRRLRGLLPNVGETWRRGHRRRVG
jgi:Acyl-CoA dehydrogenase, N-terminal domain